MNLLESLLVYTGTGQSIDRIQSLSGAILTLDNNRGSKDGRIMTISGKEAQIHVAKRLFRKAIRRSIIYVEKIHNDRGNIAV